MCKTQPEDDEPDEPDAWADYCDDPTREDDEVEDVEGADET